MARVSILFEDQPDGTVGVLPAMEDPSPQSPAMRVAETVIAMATLGETPEPVSEFTRTPSLDLRILAETPMGLH